MKVSVKQQQQQQQQVISFFSCIISCRFDVVGLGQHFLQNKSPSYVITVQLSNNFLQFPKKINFKN